MKLFALSILLFCCCSASKKTTGPEAVNSSIKTGAEQTEQYLSCPNGKYASAYIPTGLDGYKEMRKKYLLYP